MNLLKGVEVSRVMNTVAAGTTVQNSTSVDMQGFEGVMFVAELGALSANQVTNIKAQQSSDDGSADAFADLLGTLTAAMADTDDDKMVVLDIFRPRERYVRCVVNRATGNAVIEGVTAILYGARKKPTTQPATVQASEQHVSPAQGTA